MGKRKRPDFVREGIYRPFMGNDNTSRQPREQAMYRRILGELCMNRFRWTGMPDTVDLRFVEKVLFEQALCVFYFDPQYDRYMALRGGGSGVANMYENPTDFIVSGGTMLQKTVSGKDCVPIWANYLRVPDLDIVDIYSGKLASLDRTIEIQSMKMRVPYVITAPPTQRLTALNLLKQMYEGEPALFTEDGMDINSTFQVLDLKQDSNVLLNTILAKQKLWNECMTLLGINNANQDKKERLVAAEVGANDSQVGTFQDVSLNARRQACEQINAKYPGLKVWVERVDEIDNGTNAVVGDEEGQEEDNGNIHNGIA